MAVVVITPGAQAQYDALPAAIRTRIEKVFKRLEQWPNVSGANPLRHGLAGRYRVRTGDYRVQFRVESRGLATSQVVCVEKVGHRDGFYDE